MNRVDALFNRGNFPFFFSFYTFPEDRDLTIASLRNETPKILPSYRKACFNNVNTARSNNDRNHWIALPCTVRLKYLGARNFVKRKKRFKLAINFEL